MSEHHRPSGSARMRAQRDAALAERDRLRDALLRWADNVERDRREPDKILCAVQSMRRAADRA